MTGSEQIRHNKSQQTEESLVVEKGRPKYDGPYAETNLRTAHGKGKRGEKIKRMVFQHGSRPRKMVQIDEEGGKRDRRWTIESPKKTDAGISENWEIMSKRLKKYET